MATSPKRTPAIVTTVLFGLQILPSFLGLIAEITDFYKRQRTEGSSVPVADFLRSTAAVRRPSLEDRDKKVY